MAIRPAVVVVGSLNVDLVCTAPHLPNVGETVLGHSFNTFTGGKGFNQAVAAGRSGSTVGMVGKLGRDNFGQLIATALQEEQIEASAVTYCDEAAVSTGVAMITVDEVGRNTITVVPGANFKLTEHDVEAARSLISAAQVVLLQLEIPLATCVKAAQLAHEAHAKVILTAAPVPDQPLPDELLAAVDILVLNEVEVRQLEALHYPDQATSPDEEGAARRLLGHAQKAGPEAVLVTLGREGALWVDREASYRVEGFEVEAVDTTAAGDTFTGALATALGSKNYPIQSALAFANAAGALAVTRAGASVSIPRAAEIEAFLNNLPSLIQS